MQTEEMPSTRKVGKPRKRVSRKEISSKMRYGKCWHNRNKEMKRTIGKTETPNLYCDKYEFILP